MPSSLIQNVPNTMINRKRILLATPPEDFIGMTMEQARNIIVGYSVYLPSVKK